MSFRLFEYHGGIAKDTNLAHKDLKVVALLHNFKRDQPKLLLVFFFFCYFLQLLCNNNRCGAPFTSNIFCFVTWKNPAISYEILCPRHSCLSFGRRCLFHEQGPDGLALLINQVPLIKNLFQ